MDPFRVILAGFVAALAMSLVSIFPRLAGLPAVDLGQIVAAKIARLYIERPTRLGTVLHFANGIVLAVVYAVLFHSWLPGAPWLRGIVFGLLLWLALMLWVMPRVAEGLFGLRGGAMVPVVTLLMHVVYGAILGGAYGW